MTRVDTKYVTLKKKDLYGPKLPSYPGFPITEFTVYVSPLLEIFIIYNQIYFNFLHR